MENPLLPVAFPLIQPGATQIHRRPSQRWASEVDELIRRRPSFKHSTPEVTIRREQSRKWPMTEVTNRRPLTRHMSHMAHEPSIVLIEKARDGVISTKLRRQKSDLEQEVKLQQAKRRRYVAIRRDSVANSERSESEVIAAGVDTAAVSVCVTAVVHQSSESRCGCVICMTELVRLFKVGHSRLALLFYKYVKFHRSH